MQGEWKGYGLSALEMNLALAMARAEHPGEISTDLTEAQIREGLTLLAEKGMVQPAEDVPVLEGILGFVLRNYLNAARCMRLYTSRKEIIAAEGEDLWVAILRNHDHYQVIPLQTGEEALEEILDFAGLEDGHCFCQTGTREGMNQAVRPGENWRESIPEMWRGAMKGEAYGEHDSGNSDAGKQ